MQVPCECNTLLANATCLLCAEEVEEVEEEEIAEEEEEEEGSTAYAEICSHAHNRFTNEIKSNVLLSLLDSIVLVKLINQ